MAEVEVEQPQDREGELIARFATWDKALDAHWGGWREEARMCFDFVAGEQWDPTDQKKLEDIDRIAPVFNRVGPIIDAVSGAEIMDRQQVKYYPREVGDSGVNELLTKTADWVRDRCDADQEETEAFRDAFICGMGWTNTAMSYDEDPEGQIVVDRVDPLEMGLDPTSRKANGEGARYIRRDKRFSREVFEEAWPDFAPGGRRSFEMNPHVVEPKNRYARDTDEDYPTEDEVWVTEYQWFENEPLVAVEDPDDGEVVTLPLAEFEDLNARARELGVELRHVRRTERRYYRAFVAGGRILNFDEDAEEAEELAEGEFTYKLITGKRDRNRGVWYGLTRPMIDPQRWANQFMSQLLAILAASTKGGVLMETDAVEDIRQFEENWAKPAANVYLKPGALSEGRIQPKQPTPYPNGLDRLIGMSTDAIRDTTGVNPEMLGLVDREQAGVLEHQRKQAAYGILAAFFDSFRRYRRNHGRLLLKFMRYLPDGYLVRIVGDDGLAQYVPFAKQEATAKFDVIVDEAPAGPNQKAATFGVIMQLMPYLKDADLPADFWAEVAKYTPLPESLSQKMSQAVAASGQPDPNQQRAVNADIAGKEAKAAKDMAGAEKDAADAAETRQRVDAQAALVEEATMRAAMGVTFPPDQTSFGETNGS